MCDLWTKTHDIRPGEHNISKISSFWATLMQMVITYS